MATLPNPLPGLQTDPSGRSVGLRLPLGRLIDATDEGPWHEPLLWHGEYAAGPGVWTALGAPAARAGLLPVLLETEGDRGAPDEWDLAPGMMSYPGDHDPEEVLAELWEEYAAEVTDERPAGSAVYSTAGSTAGATASFGPDWPGLAPAGTRSADPGTRAAEVADSLLADGSWFKGPRFALVPARRSADIPAAIGWTGPLNHENDVARLCAVLRSWEDRFGIRVVGLAFDRLVLSVAAPPATPAEAGAVAAEHFAFCPDNLLQGRHGTLSAYAAEEVLGQHVWTFWWD